MRRLWCLLSLFVVVQACNAPSWSQTPLQISDKYGKSLSFRPGSTTDLLLGDYDNEFRLQAKLVRASPDGKHLLLRTLPGFHAAIAWLDADNVVTSDANGLLQKWPVAGGNPLQLAALSGPVVGIGVAPRSRTLAVRMKMGPIRFIAPDGKSLGPGLSIGQAPKPEDSCTPDGMETATAFSPDERLIAFAGVCAELRVSAREGARLVKPDVPRPYLKRNVFSSDGKFLFAGYTGQPGGGADIWPIAGGRVAAPRPLPGPVEHDQPADAAPLPDGAGFIVLSTGRLRYVGMDGRSIRPDYVLPGASRIALSSDGSRMAVLADEGLVLFDGAGKRLLDRPFAEFGAPIGVAVLDGGREFGALSREGVMRFFRPDGTQSRPPLEQWDYTRLDQDSGGIPGRLLASPNGRRFAVLAPTGRFEIFDEKWNKVGRPFNFPPNPTFRSDQSTVLLDDRVLRPMPDGTGYLVFSFEGRLFGRLNFATTERDPVVAAASANGTLAIRTWRRFVLVNADGQVVREPVLPDTLSSTDAISMSADGKVVVVHEPSRYESEFFVWRVGTGPERDRLQALKGSFVRVLPDGRVAWFTKGRLSVGGAEREVDADWIHLLSDDGTTALVARSSVVRLVALGR